MVAKAPLENTFGKTFGGTRWHWKDGFGTPTEENRHKGEINSLEGKVWVPLGEEYTLYLYHHVPTIYVWKKGI